MKNNSYRKLVGRDDFAEHYYCRRAREYEHRKLKMKTRSKIRTQKRQELLDYKYQ